MTTDEYVKMVNKLESLLKEAIDILEDAKKCPCSDIYSFWQGEVAAFEHALEIVKGDNKDA